MLSKFWLESGSKDGRTGLVADLRRCRGLVLVGPLSGGAAGGRVAGVFIRDVRFQCASVAFCSLCLSPRRVASGVLLLEFCNLVQPWAYLVGTTVR